MPPRAESDSVACRSSHDLARWALASPRSSRRSCTASPPRATARTSRCVPSYLIPVSTSGSEPAPPCCSLLIACRRACARTSILADYDPYRGVVVFIRVVDGVLRKGERIKFQATGVEHEVLEVGTLTPGGERPTKVLRAGEVGYLVGGIKSVADARVGDTIIARADKDAAGEPLPGYRDISRKKKL